MPVAHQSNPSILSSISNILLMRPLSQHHPQTPPQAAQPSSSSSSSSHTSSPPQHHETTEFFELNLAQRLKGLLLPPLPSQPAFFVSLAYLRHAMIVLLATESDLNAMIPEIRPPLFHGQSKTVDEFLDRSVKLLDVCNVIREAIAEVQRWEKLLRVVLESLTSSGELSESKLRRARKLLGRLKLVIEGDKEEETSCLQLHRSFRWSSRHWAELANEPRRRSWHGNPMNLSNLSAPTRQLQSIGMTLAPPKSADPDTEEAFSAAIYAMNVVSIFFLSIMIVALPCPGKSTIISSTHPRHFLWATPLFSLQEKVLEETGRRGKRYGKEAVWEVDQISASVGHLFEALDAALAPETFCVSEVEQEEIRQMVKELERRVEELKTNLGPLDEQVSDFFHRIIRARMDVLNRLSYPDA